MKKQNGVTLIALVITIIVLLILAGVSIAMLTGENGILNQATGSGQETLVGEAKEDAMLQVNELMSEYYEQKYVANAEDLPASAAAYVKENFDGTNTKYYESYDKASGKLELKEKDRDGNTVTGTIGSDGSITWSTAS